MTIEQRVNELAQGLVKVETERTSDKEKLDHLEDNIDKIIDQNIVMNNTIIKQQSVFNTALKALGLIWTIMTTVISIAFAYLSSQIG